MKKKSILLLITTIITIMLTIVTMYFTSKAANSFEIGDTVSLFMAFDYYEIQGATNLINQAAHNYFCSNQNTDFGWGEYAKAHVYKNIAIAEIKGDSVEVKAKNDFETEELNTKTGTYTETNTNANKALSLLYYKIKNNTVEVNCKIDITLTTYQDEKGKTHYTYNPEDVVKDYNGKTTLTRQRFTPETNGFELYFDYGQCAMWKVLKDWQSNVANKIKVEGSLWNGVAGALQSADVEFKPPYSTSEIQSMQIAQAYEFAKVLYDEVYLEVESAVDNEYGIDETYYKKSDKEVEIRIDENEYTILGPFQYKFSGDIENGKPTLTFDDNTTSQSYTIGKYAGGTFTETNNIVSESPFYIKVKTSSLNGVSNIYFDFQIEGISLYNTKTRVYFFGRSENLGAYQPITYFEQDEGYNTPFKDAYKISKNVEVSLEKLDVSGNALKAEGIKFQIKDNTNAVVAYFETNAEGNGIITDQNGNPTGETTVRLIAGQTYTLIENENNYYGYKKGYLTVDNIEISGAEIEQSGNYIKFTFASDCENQVTISAKNDKELANLEIEKTGANSTNLENVGFVIKVDTNNYIQLKNENDQIVATVEGSATVNSDNKANGSEYHIEYVSDKSSATQFITDADGKIVINNLEVNKSKTVKYSYTACEIYNNNYGYGLEENNSLAVSIKELTTNETNRIVINNTQELGNLELKKYDGDDESNTLPNVGFAIEISSDIEGKYAYLALYDQGENIVSTINDIATINKNNEANASEYSVSYYYTDKPYKELNDTERANITNFLTGNDGTLTVNNLEVYSSKTLEKYTYKLIETSNSNYGYIVKYQEVGNITLEANETTNAKLSNSIELTKISGYVWIENTEGKANEYDNVYTNDSSDQKLTDLYILEDGKLVKNPNAVTPVEIKLRNKNTGKIVKELPDSYDSTGKYTFENVEIEELANYEVVFVYDGFYYTTVEAKLETENGSKAKEISTERETLNNKFASIESDSQVISKDGTINSIEYYKDGHTSSVSSINFDTTISASTNNANYKLETMSLENVNMGIVLREQPKISINSDIYSALIEFEGYKYNYKYNGRQNYYENVNGDEIGVKFEQEYTIQRYTRTVYASDIQAAKDLNKEIKLSITYKIQIANQSNTLSVMPKQIINYFDSRYEIEAVGLGIDEENHTITNALGYSTAQQVEGLEQYKSTIIEFNQLIETKQNIKDLYIRFNVSREAILDLLNSKSTYHNASEILSYASYYSSETVVKEPANIGSLYAGIDKMSQPGNMELKLIDHPSGEGTQILDTTNLEDDSTTAPSLILEAAKSRTISGTIWEDAVTNTTNGQKLGDGIFDEENEKVVKGVKAELHKLNADGTVGDIATYSNGEQVSTISDEDGNYTFGYYDEEAEKYVGILPGKYVIKYIYNNEAYIVDKEYININDYKSTIITSEVVRNAFENADGNIDERWYITEEANRYSDARDDISLRPEYNNVDSDLSIINSTYNNNMVIENMNAYTPVMDIGIEFTEFDEADVLTLELLREFKNIDFGIVERPKIDITIEKEITGLEIVAQNGTSIIPYGDPTNESMQYVKALDGLVSIEVETDLLQGAELNLEYTITLANHSDKDYLESEYYYYGTGGITEITTVVKQVVDYMSGTMALDLSKTPNIWEVAEAKDLYESGLINQEVYRILEAGNYNILTTKEFDNVGIGSEKSVKLYASKYLAVSDLTREENKVEIIELTGIRTIRDSVPGNYIPTEPANEIDEDRVDLVITPPTGTTVNYIIYIIAAVATFAILVSGIVIIKKKLIK